MEKIQFRQIDESGDLEVENVWAKKKGAFYQLENIPFFILGVSCQDLIKVIEIDGQICATGIEKESGNSTVRIYLKSIDMIPIVITELKELGCEFELGFKKVLAVNIPDEVNYNPIKNYLDKGENKGTWEYDEGCIAANHSHII